MARAFFNPRWLTWVGSRAYFGQGLSAADQSEALKKKQAGLLSRSMGVRNWEGANRMEGAHVGVSSTDIEG